MNRRLILSSFVFALLTAALAPAQPAAQGYLDVYVAKVKPEKRAEFDAISKKFAAANRQHKGDAYLTYEVEYGEQNTVYFVSQRANYAAMDDGQKAFMGALTTSYGGAGIGKLFGDLNSCLVSSRSEVRLRRPELSWNLPADNAALNGLVGKSRLLRIVVVRVRPGRTLDYEVQLRMLKTASERQTPDRVTTVSQSSVGQTLGVYYLTNFGDSMAALASPKTLPELLGDRGYRDFQKISADTTLGADIIIGHWLPELSSPPAEIAAADPAFWNPKPAPPKAKAPDKK
jgi:hypothetical protein